MKYIQSIIEDLAVLKKSLPDGLMIGSLSFSWRKLDEASLDEIVYSVIKKARHSKTYYNINYTKSNCLDSCILIESVEIKELPITISKTQTCFTESDIVDYINWSGDNNSIHKGENAIVPGLMIMARILDFETYDKPMAFRAKFKEALTVNVGYRLEKCKETYRVVNDNERLIMTLNVEELQ